MSVHTSLGVHRGQTAAPQRLVVHTVGPCPAGPPLGLSGSRTRGAHGTRRRHCACSVRRRRLPRQSGQLRSGVRGLQQGRRSSAPTVLGGQPAPLRSPSPRPPLQRARIWPPVPRRWLPYAGPAVTAAAWCASPTENSAKPNCSRQAGVDTRHRAPLSWGTVQRGRRQPLDRGQPPRQHGNLGRGIWGRCGAG